MDAWREGLQRRPVVAIVGRADGQNGQTQEDGAAT